MTIKNKSYANRGRTLQLYINASNERYRIYKQAEINEVATPTKQVNGKLIYTAKSTVDYVGISHGRCIAFDAKSTRDRKRFPLGNVHEHQVDFLRRWQDQGGISFFIIEMASYGEVYYMPLKTFLPCWQTSTQGGAKSISLEDIRFNCERIMSGGGLTLDYLPHCFK